MNAGSPSRPQLKIRRVNLDTGRENVVVMSRRSKALRPEVFRGFSRVELRCNSKTLLTTLLITDDGLVGVDEIGLAEPAFRRFSEPAGSLVTVTPAIPPDSLDAVRAKIQGHAPAGSHPRRWSRSIGTCRSLSSISMSGSKLPPTTAPAALSSAAYTARLKWSNDS
jgi:thymidine phosphorylase